MADRVRHDVVLHFHIEVIDFGVADVEAAYGGLRVHGAVFGEADAYAAKVDEFRDVEDFLDVREHGVNAILDLIGESSG